MATKSDIVSGMGLALSIITNLVGKVKKAGGTDKDIHCLATPDGESILEEMARIIVGAKRQLFKVMVHYTKSLKEMIEAGQYDRVNGDITSDHFPVKGTGQKEVEITLFHFNRSISSDDAIAEMKKTGYRPALIEELLALGAEQKELQKQFPIVAFGSVWPNPRGFRHVPSLLWLDAERDLDLDWFEGDWLEDWRFAAVRK